MKWVKWNAELALKFDFADAFAYIIANHVGKTLEPGSWILQADDRESLKGETCHE